jgi:hypothetical protein
MQSLQGRVFELMAVFKNRMHGKGFHPASFSA